MNPISLIMLVSLGTAIHEAGKQTGNDEIRGPLPANFSINPNPKMKSGICGKAKARSSHQVIGHIIGFSLFAAFVVAFSIFITNWNRRMDEDDARQLAAQRKSREEYFKSNQ